MTAFDRLSRFNRAAKERASPIWTTAVRQFERGLQWLKLRPRIVFWAGGIGIALAFLIFSGPTAAGAALVGWAALRQAATASDRHQEQTIADRQRRITESFSKAAEQLASDKLEARLGGIYTLERISRESEEDYWPVMETLTAFIRERTRRAEAERTSKPFEERLAVRAYFLWENAGKPEGRSEDFRAQAVEMEKIGEPPPTEIAAVLTVITRRSEENWERERTKHWRLDFRGAVLRHADLYMAYLEGANLGGAHLEGAILAGAHLERANLTKAHLEGALLGGAHLERATLYNVHLEGAYLTGARLEGADLSGANFEGATLYNVHLEGATLSEAHLEGANLIMAHLEGANLRWAHLEGANLRWARLEGANLDGARLEGANLSEAKGLTQGQIESAFGDADTKLPERLTRPTRWPASIT